MRNIVLLREKFRSLKKCDHGGGQSQQDSAHEQSEAPLVHDDFVNGSSNCNTEQDEELFLRNDENRSHFIVASFDSLIGEPQLSNSSHHFTLGGYSHYY